MISAHRPGPNGEPGSKPSGAGAATRFWQQGQTPRWRLMRVTHRPDRRQIDVVVGVDVGQIGGAERLGAMRTGGERRLDDFVGVFGQRAGDAGAAGAGFFGGRGGSTSGPSRAAGWNCPASWAERRALLPVRQCARSTPRSASLRLDLRLLRQKQGDQVFVGQRKEGCAVHASPVIDSTVTVSSGISRRGGEQLPARERGSSS